MRTRACRARRARRACSACSIAGLAVLAALPPATASTAAGRRAVTVSDLMGLRSISDVRISPDGRQVAYVVSRPSLEQDEHEAVLYQVPAAGGTPVRLTYGTRIFNRPRPAPHLRWSPDGTRLSFLAFAGDLPQVFALDAPGGEARALTASRPLAARRTHVRAAAAPPVAGRPPGGAGAGALRPLLAVAEPRRTAARLPLGRRAEHGRRLHPRSRRPRGPHRRRRRGRARLAESSRPARRPGSRGRTGRGSATPPDRGEPGARGDGAGQARTHLLAVVRRHGDLGPAAATPATSPGTTSACPGRPRRPMPGIRPSPTCPGCRRRCSSSTARTTAACRSCRRPSSGRR